MAGLTARRPELIIPEVKILKVIIRRNADYRSVYIKQQRRIKEMICM